MNSIDVGTCALVLQLDSLFGAEVAMSRPVRGLLLVKISQETGDTDVETAQSA